GRNLYQKTSLSLLARELGVSKPALYRHFTSKQALIDAMAQRFFDDFSAAIRADFEQALQTQDPDEGIFIIVQSIAGFFIRNVQALIFSMINVYDRNLDERTITEHLKTRGVDMSSIQIVMKKYNAHPATIKLMFATLTFYTSNFHKENKSMTLEKQPSDEQAQAVISVIHKIVKSGLGFSIEKAGNLDFQKLESMVEGTMQNTTPEPLFKAVAEAVAEAGPWHASMEMVAKRMGLSKSSLYGHFKNRKDMLRRLFLGEFKRIIDFARQGIKQSTDAAEQLYLGIYSIAVYLRSRPEVLVAIGWIRTRKLDLGKPEKQMEIFRLFEDIKIESLQNITEEERVLTSHWILFLLVSILTRSYIEEGETSVDVKNDDIRVLFKFITLGLGGAMLVKNEKLGVRNEK
ncbi:MAG: TetR/AcrR family transcriptional regulator, partial [Treponema sp.]|nr:TetR/AcrR family transcriptional regulator [Treponema sp.]